MEYHLGQLVACIDGDFKFTREWEPGMVIPRKGGIYRIRTIDLYRHSGSVMPLLRFDEIHNRDYPSIIGPYEPVFDSRAFMPLDRRRLAVFRKILAPVDRVPA